MLKKYLRLMVFFQILTVVLANQAFAQLDADSRFENIEQRLDLIEKYIEGLEPSLQGFSDNIYAGIKEYSEELEKSLENYTEQLRLDVDQKLQGLDQNRVLLNPVSKSFQKIETNVGMFLIMVQKMEPIEDGYRLHLNIGNTNYISYRDFNLRIVWGKRWDSESSISYPAWRQNLSGLEFSFEGKLIKGSWNPFTVDLVPAVATDLGYIECEMDIVSVEMPLNKSTEK